MVRATHPTIDLGTARHSINTRQGKTPQEEREVSACGLEPKVKTPQEEREVSACGLEPKVKTPQEEREVSACGLEPKVKTPQEEREVSACGLEPKVKTPQEEREVSACGLEPKVKTPQEEREVSACGLEPQVKTPQEERERAVHVTLPADDYSSSARKIRLIDSARKPVQPGRLGSQSSPCEQYSSTAEQQNSGTVQLQNTAHAPLVRVKAIPFKSNSYFVQDRCVVVVSSNRGAEPRPQSGHMFGRSDSDSKNS
ncbi:hypothetical protein RRG08_010389 [Elysia crispata]|uniref:Uncharacterized protein n=1 Tax=Elysia crispata TaxID=231223 RepID=A0AAE1EE46_9GAST|nr:hypothetical protein RRG08_010389 [Elysia crispata]